jgi:hypothetical protein
MCTAVGLSNCVSAEKISTMTDFSPLITADTHSGTLLPFKTLSLRYCKVNFGLCTTVHNNF